MPCLAKKKKCWIAWSLPAKQKQRWIHAHKKHNANNRCDKRFAWWPKNPRFSERKCTERKAQTSGRCPPPAQRTKLPCRLSWSIYTSIPHLREQSAFTLERFFNIIFVFIRFWFNQFKNWFLWKHVIFLPIDRVRVFLSRIIACYGQLLCSISRIR